MTEGLAIYEKLAMILAKLPAIGKDSQAPANMGGYWFRSIEDITAALKPLLAEHGVFMAPQVIDRLESTRSTRSGSSLYIVDLHVQFWFRATDGSALMCSVWGEGSDSGDKATQKAMTSAFKSMLAIVFCIADSELDAEAHSVPETDAVVRQQSSLRETQQPAPPAEPPTPITVAEIEKMSPPQLMNALRSRGLRAEGTQSQWREQLKDYATITPCAADPDEDTS